MMSWRIALFGGATCAAAGAVVFACTFSDPTFAPDASTPEADATIDTAKPNDVDPNGGDAEAGLVDVHVVDTNNCCDCDDDDYLANAADASCTADAGDAGLPKGDCDDGIDAVKPNASFAANADWKSTHQPKYDWNCDGTVTKQLNHDLKCGLGCSGEGFTDDPGCGVTSNYFECKLGLNGCQPSSLGDRTQACR